MASVTETRSDFCARIAAHFARVYEAVEQGIEVQKKAVAFNKATPETISVASQIGIGCSKDEVWCFQAKHAFDDVTREGFVGWINPQSARHTIHQQIWNRYIETMKADYGIDINDKEGYN